LVDGDLGIQQRCIAQGMGRLNPVGVAAEGCSCLLGFRQRPTCQQQFDQHRDRCHQGGAVGGVAVPQNLPAMLEGGVVLCSHKIMCAGHHKMGAAQIEALRMALGQL
jgi:hypothetical protein